LHVIVERFGQLTDRFEVIMVVGSDYADVASGTELSFNAEIAANLGSPVVLVVHGRGRSPERIRAAAASAIAELRANHARTVAVIANRVDHEAADAVRAALADLPDDVVTAAIQESRPHRPSERWSRPLTASWCWAAKPGWIGKPWN
jgi:phosphate acetyltransferase